MELEDDQLLHILPDVKCSTSFFPVNDEISGMANVHLN